MKDYKQKYVLVKYCGNEHFYVKGCSLRGLHAVLTPGSTHLTLNALVGASFITLSITNLPATSSEFIIILRDVVDLLDLIEKSR